MTEYHIAQNVLSTGCWIPTGIKEAMVRIGPMQAAYKLVMNIPLLWVFNTAHPIVFAFTLNLEFVEREVTPRFLMKISIQLHLAGLSLSNPVSILEIFGVERARSTVYNWVHKADLQPESGQCPDHIAVDETVIQLNDEQYWLYAAVDPETNELLHTKLEATITKVLAHSFLTELSEILDTKNMEIGMLSNVSLEK